jgi:hypothetical protein
VCFIGIPGFGTCLHMYVYRMFGIVCSLYVFVVHVHISVNVSMDVGA